MNLTTNAATEMKPVYIDSTSAFPHIKPKNGCGLHRWCDN